MFGKLQNVVELIKQHFGERKPHAVDNNFPTIPAFSVPSHEEPRFLCFAEKEAGGVSQLYLVSSNFVIRYLRRSILWKLLNVEGSGS